VLRVVLDVNVVVSALLAPLGPPGRVLDAALRGRLGVVGCPRWALEVVEVAARPKFEGRLRAERQAALVALRAAADMRQEPAAVAAVTGDPDDDYLVALALDAGCDAIVSGDRHLLALAGPPAVWTPRELLARLGAAAGR